MSWLEDLEIFAAHKRRDLIVDCQIFRKDWNYLFPQEGPGFVQAVGRGAFRCYDMFTDPERREKKNIAVTARCVGAGLRLYSALHVIYSLFTRPTISGLAFYIGLYVVGHDVFKSGVNLAKNNNDVRPFRELSYDAQLWQFRETLAKLVPQQGSWKTWATNAASITKTPKSEKDDLLKKIELQREWYKNQFTNLYSGSLLYYQIEIGLDTFKDSVEKAYNEIAPES